jgi:hypothetical protein
VRLADQPGNGGGRGVVTAAASGNLGVTGGDVGEQASAGGAMFDVEQLVAAGVESCGDAGHAFADVLGHGRQVQGFVGRRLGGERCQRLLAADVVDQLEVGLGVAVDRRQRVDGQLASDTPFGMGEAHEPAEDLRSRPHRLGRQDGLAVEEVGEQDLHRDLAPAQRMTRAVVAGEPHGHVGQVLGCLEVVDRELLRVEEAVDEGRAVLLGPLRECVAGATFREVAYGPLDERPAGGPGVGLEGGVGDRAGLETAQPPRRLVRPAGELAGDPAGGELVIEQFGDRGQQRRGLRASDLE